MSLLVILLFIGNYGVVCVGDDPGPANLQQVQPVAREFGINAAAAILRQEGISDVEIVAHDQMLGDHFITSLVYFLLHVLPLLGGRRE